MKKPIRKISKALIIIALVLATVFGAFCIYSADYYRADNDAITAFSTTIKVKKYSIDKNATAYEPTNAKAGFIFYPGGKVEASAYEPLMLSLAERGILCVLIEMPFNLAVLDINAADGILEKFPSITEFYIGGHSLGGSMAAYYIDKNRGNFKGLVLLGSYSTADLSKSNLKVLSVYGSEDKVLNKDKYLKYRSNLPENMTEFVIDGGCHAYFGMYGAQEGDGVPTISNEQQIDTTSSLIEKMISE